jgi:hypothetical protein
MSKEKVADLIKDLDTIFKFFDENFGNDEYMHLLVRLYETSIRPALNPLEHKVALPVEHPVPVKKRNHYKRRYKCRVTGTQVSDPLAVELRKKYKTPVIAERLNKIMEVLRSHATSMEVEDLVPLTSLKKWCIEVHLKYAIAKGLIIMDKGQYWAKVVFDRRPDIKVQSKSFVKEE